MSTMRKCLFSPIVEAPASSANKVTIVGTGQVGMACTISLLTQKLTSNICLLDLAQDKIQGELMDMQHAAVFLNSPKVTASTDFAASAQSRICVISAGARHGPNETRLDLVQKNTDIMKQVIPQLIKHSPDTILLLITNPVDIAAYAAWKISGLPINRVLGSGTNLDSARFRHFISQRLGIAPCSVQGWIIGEHGDSSVPLWSTVSVGGVKLRDLNPKLGIEDDPEKWNEIPKKVVSAGYDIMAKKGFTNWGIGCSIASLVSSILRNTNEVFPVSTNVCGQHGIDKDTFLSLPCVLNGEGVSSIVKQPLECDELKLFQKSAEIVGKAQAQIKF